MMEPLRVGIGLAPRFSRVGASVLFHGLSPALDPPKEVGAWRQTTPWFVDWRLSSLALDTARDASVRLPEDIRAELGAHTRSDAMVSLRLEAAIPEIISALGSAEIPVILLKGPGLAQRDARLASRAYVDIDLMVPVDALERASELLVGLGFFEPDPDWEPRRAFRFHFRHAVPLYRDGVSIDLHHVLPPVVLGRRLSFSRMHADAAMLSIGGTKVAIPSPIHATIMAALHVLSSAGGAWPRPWRDVAVLLSSPVGVDELIAEARRLNLLVPLVAVASALHGAWGLEIPLLRRLNRVDGPRGARLRIWAMSWARPWNDHQLSEMIRLPFGSALRFGFAFAVPDAVFLRARYPESRSRIAMQAKWWGSSLGRLGRVAAHRHIDLRLPEHSPDQDSTDAGGSR